MSARVPNRFADVLDPMGELAVEAMRDMFTPRGAAFRRAVGAGRMHVVDEPGVHVEVDNAIVLGANLRGRAGNGSYVIDVGNGGGFLQTRDSVVVGNGVRVLSHGNTTVRGRNTSVAIGSRGAARTTVKRRRDVSRRRILGSSSSSSSSSFTEQDSPRIETSPATVGEAPRRRRRREPSLRQQKKIAKTSRRA